MNTKSLGNQALSTIDNYVHFGYASAVTRVPYYNNKVKKTRGAFRTQIGKGRAEEIHDEVHTEITKLKIDASKLSDEALKKFLVDNNLGIDCSAFAFYVLNSEMEELGKGTLEKKIKFINCKGLVGKMRCALRPVENCDVKTLADDENSSEIKVGEILPGDLITVEATDDSKDPDRDHVLVIYQVDYDDSVPKRIHYCHAIAYPEDGLYDSGVRYGSIEVTSDNILHSIWKEDSNDASLKRLIERARKSKTRVRRLKAFQN